jgi:hypothetical protein
MTSDIEMESCVNQKEVAMEESVTTDSSDDLSSESSSSILKNSISNVNLYLTPGSVKYVVI